MLMYRVGYPDGWALFSTIEAAEAFDASWGDGQQIITVTAKVNLTDSEEVK